MDSVDSILNAVEKYGDKAYELDILKLKQTIDFITTIVNYVLGFIVWALVVLFLFVTVMDVLYLTIPVVRSSIQKTGLYGKKKFGKFRLVSYDADKAIERAELKGAVTPLAEYLKIRIWTYIFVAVMLTILLNGGWEWLKNFLQPIIVTIVSFFY